MSLTGIWLNLFEIDVPFHEQEQYQKHGLL